MIGTNKSDAAQTVRSLMADVQAADAQSAVPGSRRRVEETLAGRGVQPVSYTDWLAIEKREMELAAELGRGQRVKLVGWDTLLATCGAAPREPGGDI